MTGDFAAEIQYAALGQGKSQACASRLRGEKGPEHLRLVPCRDAGTFILHPDPDPLACAGTLDGAAQGDSTAAGSGLQGIHHQVLKDFLEDFFVTLHRQWL